MAKMIQASSSSELHRDSQKKADKYVCYSEGAESIISSTDKTADHKKITDKLNEFFKVQHNVIFERGWLYYWS